MRFAALFVLLAFTVSTPGAAGSAESRRDSVAARPKPSADRLPPSLETALAALERSPRHGEYLEVRAGETPIRTWIVYPERKEKAGVVIVIHEIYGLSDWIRGVADQLASDGFIAVAPDLVSGLGPGGGGTDSAASRDDVVKLVRSLTPEETARRIDAVRRHATALPASNGKVATLGFCWGGSRSFEYATAEPAPQAAVVYYGASPDSATLLRVRAPVLGLYGGDDARVTSTIEPARRALKRLERSYEPHVFDGAGHGFLRAQEQRDGANLAATRKAWPLTVRFLRRQLE